MVITINKPVLFYWAFALIFEVIYFFYLFRKGMSQMQKSPHYPLLKSYYDNALAFQVARMKVFSPVTFVAAFVILVVVSPFIFPFSLVSLAKELVGYKSKLEKALDAESAQMEAAKKASEDFMKTEGVFSPNEESHPHHELDIDFVKKQGGIADDLQDGD